MFTNTPNDDVWFALYPYGGGGVGSYRTLIPFLGGRYCHVPELPGRDRRHAEPAHTDFDTLADDLATQLDQELQTRRPENLVLFGYSLGAMMAARMATRLEARGAGPRALVVAGASSPDRWDHAGIGDLPDEAFIARFRKLGIAPAEILDDPYMVALFMSVWRADTKIAESVRADPDFSLACPLIAAAGTRDMLADQDDVHAWVTRGGPGSTGSQYRGDHGTLIHNPALAARLLQHAAALGRPAAVHATTLTNA